MRSFELDSLFTQSDAPCWCSQQNLLPAVARMARRHAFPFLGNGDKSLSAVLRLWPDIALPHDKTVPAAAAAAAALESSTFFVAPGFVDGALLDAARDAASSVFDSQDVPRPFVEIMASIEALRIDLAAASGRELLESAELQLLSYREGGAYRRHVDQANGVVVGPGGRGARRSVSMVLFLTPDDWHADTDGGSLRIHAHKGGGACDVAPVAGSLVLFDSATVPHEVLKTNRQRTVLAIWLQEEAQAGG